MESKPQVAFDPEENAWQRGREEYNRWLHDFAISWVVAFIAPALLTLAAELIYIHSSLLLTGIFSLGAGVIVLLLVFLISFVYHEISGLRHQRDEARVEIQNVSSKLQAKESVLQSTIGELVDLEVKYKKVDEAHQPIRELAAFKSGDTVKGKKFNVSLMFNQMNTSVIANVTFENCTFQGPCVIFFMGANFEISGTSFEGNLDNVVVKADSNKGYKGLCAFLNCKIRNCKFVNVGVIGDDSLKETLQNAGKPS
jgi:hypothetical protein